MAGTTTAINSTLIAGQKDTTFTKIFVGGLPYHTTDQTLREYFEQFGQIDEAVVITDRQTGKSRGYGFVTMADKPGADRATKDPNPIIDGRKANVNLAYLGAKPRINASLPFAIKGLHTAAAVVPSSAYGYPAAPYLYPSAYLSQGSVLAAIPSAMSPNATAAATAGTAPATAAQYTLDYPAAYAAAAAGQYATTAGAYDAYSAYTTTPSQSHYAALPGTATAYYAMPGQLTASGTPNFAHFAQTSQIPERL